MRIYTKTGDSGETGLVGGRRVRKADPRVEAYGVVDETNACIGLARAWLQEAVTPRQLSVGQPSLEQLRLDDVLSHIQNDLFRVGAELATPPGEDGNVASRIRKVTSEDVARLEQWIDQLDEELPSLTRFVLPGGSTAASALHLARTTARRAERRVVELSDRDAVSPELVRYLNRLSDLLFTVARAANLRGGKPEVHWEG